MDDHTPPQEVIDEDAMSGTFETGVRNLGLAEGGVGWAQDEHNAKLVSADMKAKIDQASKDIVDGKVMVHDYQSDSTCPF